MNGELAVVVSFVARHTVPSQQETGLGTAGIIAMIVGGIMLIIALVVILKTE